MSANGEADLPIPLLFSLIQEPAELPEGGSGPRRPGKMAMEVEYATEGKVWRITGVVATLEQSIRELSEHERQLVLDVSPFYAADYARRSGSESPETLKTALDGIVQAALEYLDGDDAEPLPRKLYEAIQHAQAFA